MNYAHSAAAFVLGIAIGFNFSPKTPAEWFLLIAVAVWLSVGALPKRSP